MLEKNEQYQRVRIIDIPRSWRRLGYVVAIG
jgi:hypothetical protein